MPRQNNQLQGIVIATSARLDEMFEGYVLLAIIPQLDGQEEVPLTMSSGGSAKTKLALKAMAADFLAQAEG